MTKIRTVGKKAALGMTYGGPQHGLYAGKSGRWPQKWYEEMATMSMNETNEARFRSFCERYMIERASTFRADHEEEDQWTCLLNAKSAYRKIEAMGRGITNEDKALQDKRNAEQDAMPPPLRSGVGQQQPHMIDAMRYYTHSAKVIKDKIDNELLKVFVEGTTKHSPELSVHDEQMFIQHGKKKGRLK